MLNQPRKHPNHPEQMVTDSSICMHNQHQRTSSHGLVNSKIFFYQTISNTKNLTLEGVQRKKKTPKYSALQKDFTEKQSFIDILHTKLSSLPSQITTGWISYKNNYTKTNSNPENSLRILDPETLTTLHNTIIDHPTILDYRKVTSQQSNHSSMPLLHTYKYMVTRVHTYITQCVQTCIDQKKYIKSTNFMSKSTVSLKLQVDFMSLAC